MDQIDADLLSRDQLSSLLHYYRDAGIDWLLEDSPVDRVAEFAALKQARAAAPVARDADPELRPRRELPGREAARPAAPVVASPVVPDGQAVAEAQALASAAGDIEALERAVADFTGCNLRNSARSTAFVDGNRKSRIVIIGAVSTAEDDRDGVPFSGPAGDLLDRMLKAIGLSRQDVLLANIIPWRPPGSRAPSRPEMDICRPFVERLLSLARPEAVLLLGNFPARFFLDANGSIHGLRGRWFDLPVAEGETVPALATFHPSDILQAPLNKPLVWRDLLMFRMALAPQAPR